MEMPQVTDAHRQLHRLNGNWEGSETISPSPWDPAGGTALGKSSNRIILDGFAVAHDYEQHRHGQCSFRGHGVFTWDARDAMYYLHWFDTMCTTVNTYSGRMEGDVLHLENVNPEVKSRAVFDLSRPDGYAFRMDVSQDGTQWMTFMDGRYTRLPDVPLQRLTSAPAKAAKSKPKAKSKTKTKAKAKVKAKAKPASKPKKSAKSPVKKSKPVAKAPKKKAKKK